MVEVLRREDGVLFDLAFDFGQYRLLDLRVLDHGFDHQVDVPKSP